jgi:hypothetical protein
MRGLWLGLLIGLLILVGCSQGSPISAPLGEQSQETEIVAPAPESTPVLTPVMSAQIGEIITFGPYEWQVLAVEDGKALLITKDIIDLRAYNEESEAVTWETCTLRTWLNSEFYNRFSIEEREHITETLVMNEDNPEEGTPGGDDTRDKIFLLSLAEAERYFSGDEARLAQPNLSQAELEDVARRISESPNWSYSYDEALAELENAIEETESNGAWWWLRSPGFLSDFALGIHLDGSLNSSDTVDNVYNGVRPALWLNP